MVRKLNRTINIEKEIQEKKAKDTIWKYPGHTQELLTIFLPDVDDDKLEKMKKRRLKNLERANYIELKDEDEIRKVFGKKANGKWNAWHEDRLIFAVWKYSQMLTVIENAKERDELFARIDTACENEILNEVVDSKICKRANFFDFLGKIELSNKGELVKRNEKDNSIVWKSNKNKATYPARRKIDLFDLSMATIKKAIEVRGLNLAEDPKAKAKKAAKAKAKKEAENNPQ